ncbi:MAG TPA: proprotein convertase P-domain-containing protein, partial [Abditibacteriaceae bacterium]|nr:proprotein convertase P-domain-containing protein [Abditibacteriaceae bacterium]
SAITTKSMPLVQSVEFARRPAPAGFSRSPNLLINDNSTVSDAQVVAGTGTVGEAVLSLNIQHDFIGDLRVKLYAPDGTSVVLHKADGIAGTDRAGALIYTNRSLPWLMGRPIAGPWRLEVSDFFETGAGRLFSWSLQLWQRWTRIARDTDGPALGGVYKGRWTGIWDTVNTPPGVYEIRARAVTANAAVQDVHTNISIGSSIRTAWQGLPDARGRTLAGRPGTLVALVSGSPRHDILQNSIKDKTQ